MRRWGYDAVHGLAHALVWSFVVFLSRIRCFHSPTVNSGYSKTAQGRDKMQEDKVRLADNEVKEGTACAAARLALAPLA